MKGIEGESFKDTDLRVYERRTANPSIVYAVLKKGGIFIPMVEATLLGDYGGITPVVVVKASQQEDTAQSYDNIGMVQIAMGNYSQALESHQKALAIRKQVQGEPPRHHAVPAENGRDKAENGEPT